MTISGKSSLGRMLSLMVHNMRAKLLEIYGQKINKKQKGNLLSKEVKKAPGEASTLSDFIFSFYFSAKSSNFKP